MNEINNTNLKENRVINTARTVVVSFGYTAIVTIIPFVLRTLMIYNLGDKYAGLNSVIISVVSLLGMSEAGVGSVIIFFLYRPLAENDKAKIEIYLSELKKVYYVIGCVIFLIGISIMPFFKYIIKDEIPQDTNAYLAFFLYLLSTLFHYFLFPESAALFSANQRGDIVNGILLCGNIVAYIIQFIAIVVFRSFNMYFVALIIQGLVQGLLRGILKKIYFKNIHPRGKVCKKEKKEIYIKVLSLIGHQIDERVISSIDNILLSHYCGLVIVTLYGNYMFVVSGVAMVFSSLFDSLTASIGNAVITESKSSNYNRFKAVLLLNGAMVIWATSCMLCLYQTFMTIWMGNRKLEFGTMILFCIYFYVAQIRKTVIVFKNASGLWWEDRFKPYISMVINLLLDVFLVKIIGVKGALLSSIFCIGFIELPWEGKILFDYVFETRFYDYLRTVFLYGIVTLVVSIVSFGLCKYILLSETIISLFIAIIICSFAFVIVFGVLFRKSEEMKMWLSAFNTLAKTRTKR